MRIATWNVNSVRTRLPRLLPWLDQRQPDVVCLQETKLTDQGFAELLDAEFGARGYQVAHHGVSQWNGVAILSRAGLEDVVRGLTGEPGFPDLAGPTEARAVSATCAGLRVTSVYVPNGRTPGDPHYAYKLAWLAALRDTVSNTAESNTAESNTAESNTAESNTADTAPGNTVLCGDMNIAATDADVWDPALFVGATHVTPAERAALAELLALGLRDVLRDRWPDQRVFSYWDYRAGRFHQDLGMRIDLVLAAEPLAHRVAAAWVDREARKGSGPSDHAPVMVDLDVAPDGDIGPVVPPPSRPKRLPARPG